MNTNFNKRESHENNSLCRPLSGIFLFAPQTSDLQACSNGLSSRVRAVCLPAFSEPWEHIPRSEQSFPWGRRLRECV